MAIRTAGLDHLHVRVANAERALAFYSCVFGAEEVLRVGAGLVFVRLGGGAVIGLDGRPDEERNPEHAGLRLGNGQDLDTAVEEVVRAGGSLLERGEHAPGMSYAYVADPDGNVFEL